MKIVILERNSVGTDVSVDCIGELGEMTVYDNTVTLEEVRERVKDADIVIANKSPLRRETLEDAPNVKLICEFATGFDNCDLSYCASRGIKVANVRDYCTAMVAQFRPALLRAGRQDLGHRRDGQHRQTGGEDCPDLWLQSGLPFHHGKKRLRGISPGG